MNTNKNKIIVGVVCAVIIIAGGFFIAERKSAEETMLENTETSSETNTSASQETLNPSASTSTSTETSAAAGEGSTTAQTGTTKSGFTMADVRMHASASSCYSAVNGSVYDLTSWISQHPGGAQQILGICGKDGSSAFNGQHGGERRPESELAGFKIGVLQ